MKNVVKIDGSQVEIRILTMRNRRVAQLGRALRSGRRGRWFESSHADARKKSSKGWLFSCTKRLEIEPAAFDRTERIGTERVAGAGGAFLRRTERRPSRRENAGSNPRQKCIFLPLAEDLLKKGPRRKSMRPE